MRWAFALVAVALIVFGLFGCWPPAIAHDAPQGWSYSAICCSDYDCGQLHTPVTATAAGWLISETGETVPYGDSRIKDSQDEFFHRCENRSVSQLPNGLQPTRCLYVPPQGS